MCGGVDQCKCFFDSCSVSDPLWETYVCNALGYHLHMYMLLMYSSVGAFCIPHAPCPEHRSTASVAAQQHVLVICSQQPKMAYYGMPYRTPWHRLHLTFIGEVCLTKCAVQQGALHCSGMMLQPLVHCTCVGISCTGSCATVALSVARANCLTIVVSLVGFWASTRLLGLQHTCQSAYVHLMMQI